MATRRDFLGLGSAGLAAAALPGAAPPRTDPRHFTVEKIERTTLRVPYRDVVARSMDRELPHWRYSEVCEVRLASGAVGFGETMLYYTWGVTGDEHVKRAMGKNAARKIRKTAARSPPPSASVAAGSQAMGEMGRRHWITEFVSQDKRAKLPSASPNGMPSPAANANPVTTRKIDATT